MNVSTLMRLGMKHAGNAVAESVYLRSGLDMTRPISFYALVNQRCNARCRHCEYWRLEEYSEEMTIEEWKRALLSIRNFVGSYSISFSGGEPLAKKGFLDLLAFCRPNGIHAGVTTNGALLSEKNAARIAAARPFNVNISCDAPNAEVHDYFRGVPGIFDRLCKGIRHLRREQEARGVTFPIVLKPTITSLNFRLLPDLVEWAGSAGATAVNFQPLDRWTPETYDELWIEEESWEELGEVMDRLVQMKHAGAPIMNSDEVLRLTVNNFREEKAPPEVLPCLVGMREYFIRANGDVYLCFHFEPAGNVREQEAREIWKGKKAAKLRRDTVACRKLCLITCLSQKTLKDKVSQARKLLGRKGRKKRTVRT